MRRFLVGLLITISMLALILSSTSLWTRRHVVDTGGFVSTTEQVANDPAVRARVTQQIVNGILTQPKVKAAVNQAIATLPPALQTFKPNLQSGVRSLLTTGVNALLTTSAFQQLTRSAVTVAHNDLVAGKDIRFTVGDARQAAPASARNGPAGQLLSLVPDNVGVTVLQKSQAPQLYSAINVLKSLWLWAGLVALVSFAGAVAVSHRRRRTIRSWAVSTGVAGLIVALALTVARPVVLSKVDPGGKNAAAAIYDIVIDSLRNWTLWLVLIMAVLVVVTSLWGRLHLAAAGRRAFSATRSGATRLGAASKAGVAGAAGTVTAAHAQHEPWHRRLAANTTTMLDDSELPARLSGPAAAIQRHPRAWRWGGVVVGFLFLLFWPGHTLTVLFWVAALVALYLGALQLIQTLAARAATPDTGTAAHPVDASAHAGTPRVPEPEAAATSSGPTEGPSDVEGPSPAESRSQLATLATADTGTLTAREESTAATMTVADQLVTTDARLKLLSRLGEAHEAGLLTDAEFKREKRRVLNYQTSTPRR